MAATIGSEIARISGARDELAEKMGDAGYELTGEERIDELASLVDLRYGTIPNGEELYF